MEIEKYLEHIASRFSEIRNLFGWRQEDAAIRMGVSRSKIVTIENDHSKLTICDAQSLFTACDYELFKAKKTLKEIKIKGRNKKVKSALIASSTFLTSPLFASSIVGLLAALRPKSFSKLIPVVSGIFGSVWATNSAKTKREKQIEELTQEEIIDFSTIEESMEKTLVEIEKNLLDIFLLSKWDVHLFYERLHPSLKLPLDEEI
ncbi:helix-turn-helix domain-containing protein [Neobacillus drentensis]|uniref:helix-turn-helix domain-containing protein n=1 Tax=Neobacillus drentensis TaxID=220684 RepID=UPI0008264E7A|nr:helix-turn-helix transcriptional regulator [Neobacillus drentensis]